MSNYYCKYCGHKSSAISTLTAQSYSKHPDGRGKHALYEGSEKAKYSCRFCGHSSGSIATLTAQSCARHPDGKGKHQPAL